MVTLAINLDTRDEVHEALRNLGETSDEIAMQMRAKKVKGVPKKDTSCPIAHYLANEFPALRFKVQTYYVEVHNSSILIIDNPIPVRTFVRRFDNGEFPELETIWGKIRKRIKS